MIGPDHGFDPIRRDVMHEQDYALAHTQAN